MTRRLDNSWREALRNARTAPHLRELVRYLARRAAEEDFGRFVARQRSKTTEEPKNKD